jgi:hypothetical protein
MNRRTQRTLLTAVRERLGTWPADVSSSEWQDPRAMARLQRAEQQFEELLGRIRAFGELFVGMANGPFLLVLKASKPEQFIEFANRNPTHHVGTHQET